jgi:NifU-like protein involved in Fe-S cluster formation
VTIRGEPDEVLKQLYSDKLLEHAAHPMRQKRLDDPDVTITTDNPLCGSRVTVDLRMDGDTIADFGQDVTHACKLTQGTASIIAQSIVGKTVEETRKAADALKAILKKREQNPDGAWPEFELLGPAADHKSRHSSIMLPFKALELAFRKLEDEGDEAQTKAAV